MKKKRDLDLAAAQSKAVNLSTMQKNLDKHLVKAMALQAKHYDSKHKS